MYSMHLKVDVSFLYVQANLVEHKNIIIDAKSGVSGAG